MLWYDERQKRKKKKKALPGLPYIITMEITYSKETTKPPVPVEYAVLFFLEELKAVLGSLPFTVHIYRGSSTWHLEFFFLIY